MILIPETTQLDSNMASAAPPATLPANDRVVLYNVSWETYATLRKNLGESPIRLTFDGNNLEIMSPSRWHERAKTLLGRMVEALTLELNIPVSSGGSMTFQRADLERGLEPDECYWIANETVVREKLELDLTTDPPPDLAIEVDISPSRLDRPRIYAKLQVPEIWRYTTDRNCALKCSGRAGAINPRMQVQAFHSFRCGNCRVSSRSPSTKVRRRGSVPLSSGCANSISAPEHRALRRGFHFQRNCGNRQDLRRIRLLHVRSESCR